jgi:hypothetical protein
MTNKRTGNGKNKYRGSSPFDCAQGQNDDVRHNKINSKTYRRQFLAGREKNRQRQRTNAGILRCAQNDDVKQNKRVVPIISVTARYVVFAGRAYWASGMMTQRAR